MPYTARDLISRSFYLSNIASKDFEDITGDQINNGLQLLNSLLDWKSIETELLPFYKKYTFPAIAGVSEYFIPNLFDIETLTFDLNSNVRFPSKQQTRKEFYGGFKVYNINNLPLTWYPNRENNGTTIELYFNPQQNFPINIVGKFGLIDVSLNEDLSLTYDRGYLEYLRYALADYICNEYGGELSPRAMQTLLSMERKLTFTTSPDTSINKSSVFSRGNYFNWGYVNLSGGYVP